MQETQSLFSLNIDPEVKSHLNDTARWARFLSITGMIFLALFAIGSVFGLGMGSTLSGDPGIGNAGQTQVKVIMIISSLIAIVIIFFPLLFLFRFSGQMKTALLGNDQQALSEAFLNVKRYFRYLGILVILALVLYALIFVIFIAGFAVFGGG